MIEFGSHGSYEWLVTEEDVDCWRFAQRSWWADMSASNASGVYTLNENEKAAGWNSRNKIAYSPKIRNVGDLRTVT